MVLEALSAERIGTAELLTPASEYETMQTDNMCPLTDMTLPLSAVGGMLDAAGGMEQPLAASAETHLLRSAGRTAPGHDAADARQEYALSQP
jgi:hypothetical protein